MPAKYVPGQGWVSSYEQAEEELRGIQTPTSTLPERGLSSFEYQMNQSAAMQDRALQQQIANAPNEPRKEFFNLGDTAIDTLQAFPNALLAIPTDIVDLAAGIGDTIDQTYRSITDPDYSFNQDQQFFNDANNPLTAARRNFSGTSRTYAGEIVSTGLRIATLALPYNWLNAQKWAKLPMQLQKIGNLAGR